MDLFLHEFPIQYFTQNAPIVLFIKFQHTAETTNFGSKYYKLKICKEFILCIC